MKGCAKEKRIRDNIAHISTLKNNFIIWNNENVQSKAMVNTE